MSCRRPGSTPDAISNSFLRIFRFVALAMCFFVLMVSCKEKPKAKISLEAYKSQSSKMIQIANKLLGEQDAKTLNRAANGIEKARVLTCVDVADECQKYGKLLSKSIEVSADGELDNKDRESLRKLRNEMLQEIKKGLQKIKVEN